MLNESLLKTVVLDKVRFSLVHETSKLGIPGGNVHAHVLPQIEHAGRRFIVELEAILAGHKVESEKLQYSYPADWVEAFKWRFYKAWWMRWYVRRHPVRWTRREVEISTTYIVCPHLPTDATGKHLSFVVLERESYDYESLRPR